MTETPKTPRIDRPILCQSCLANIGTALAQTEGSNFSANNKSFCQATLAQQIHLILLGEKRFCANFQYLYLRGIENIILIKNTIKNIRTRPRVRVRVRKSYNAHARALFYKAIFATSSTSTASEV